VVALPEDRGHRGELIGEDVEDGVRRNVQGGHARCVEDVDQGRGNDDVDAVLVQESLAF